MKATEITGKELSNSKYIKTKDIGDGIKVYNFTHRAFYDKEWNKFTMTARGLFMNDDDKIVARGYDKFFNIGEKETIEELAKQFSHKQQIEISKKENGFLGIISYVPEKQDLIVTSKGNGKDYSDLFKKILIEVLDKKGKTLQEFTDYMKKELKEFSLTFEVISNKDKHVVDYHDENKLFLLNVIKNTFDGQDLLDNYSKEKTLKDIFGFDLVDKETLIFETEQDFIDFVKSKKDEKYIEGYVLTNLETGKKVKLKTDWYLSKKKQRNFANKTINQLAKIDDKQMKIDFLEEQLVKDKKAVNNSDKIQVIKIVLDKIKKDKTFDDMLFEDIFGTKKVDITKIK